MCSNRCANPVLSRGSIRNPIRYITSTSTTGAAWFSLTTTRRPLGSLRYSTGTEKEEPDEAADGCGGAAAADEVASAARQMASTEIRMTLLDDIGPLKDCRIDGLQDCRIAA